MTTQTGKRKKRKDGIKMEHLSSILWWTSTSTALLWYSKNRTPVAWMAFNRSIKSQWWSDVVLNYWKTPPKKQLKLQRLVSLLCCCYGDVFGDTEEHASAETHKNEWQQWFAIWDKWQCVKPALQNWNTLGKMKNCHVHVQLHRLVITS